MKIVLFKISLLIFISFSLSLKAAEKLTLVTEHWPPFNFLNAEGKVDGIATNTIKQIVSEAGFDYDIELLAWRRAYNKAKNNKNVLLYTIYKLDNRTEDFQWICPLIQTPGVKVYALSERDDIKISKLEDLRHYVIGIINTGWTFEYFKINGFKPGEHLDLGKSESANIKKLLLGRVDLVVQEEELVGVRLVNQGKKHNAVKEVFTLLTEAHKEGCIATSKSTPENVVARLRAALLKVNQMNKSQQN